MRDNQDEIDLTMAILEKAFSGRSGKIELTSLRGRLVELRSTEEELRSLDMQHKLGYIKDDDYLHRHDQLNLRRNVLLDEINQRSVTPLVDAIEDTGARSKMSKVADGIVSYKDLLKALAEIGAAAARRFISG